MCTQPNYLYFLRLQILTEKSLDLVYSYRNITKVHLNIHVKCHMKIMLGKQSTKFIYNSNHPKGSYFSA